MQTLRSILSPSRRSGTLLALCLAVGACAAPDSGGEGAPSGDEQSVKPGINDSFLSDGAVERYTERFETESREIYAQREAILAEVDLQPGMAVADVGAGTGLFLRAFSEAVGPDGTLYAVDLAPKFIGWLRGRAAREGLRNVEVVQCTERSAELEAGSVDLIFICDTYHHFEFPRSTLASLHAALRPGGELVVIDFHRIEGETREWLLDHVRAGEEVFTAEIEEAGFERVARNVDLLEENYFLRFRRTDGGERP